MSARQRRVIYVFGLLLIGGVSIARIVTTPNFSTTLIAIAVVVVTILIWAVVAIPRAGIFAEKVRKRRPGITVIPGCISGDMVDYAREYGARARNWNGQGGSPVALAVLPDVIEVWGPRGTEPRWTVQRVPGGVGIDTAIYGNRFVRVVAIKDGTREASFVPAYNPARAAGGLVVTEDLERAVAELSEGSPWAVHVEGEDWPGESFSSVSEDD